MFFLYELQLELIIMYQNRELCGSGNGSGSVM